MFKHWRSFLAVGLMCLPGTLTNAVPSRSLSSSLAIASNCWVSPVLLEQLSPVLTDRDVIPDGIESLDPPEFSFPELDDCDDYIIDVCDDPTCPCHDMVNQYLPTCTDEPAAPVSVTRTPQPTNEGVELTESIVIDDGVSDLGTEVLRYSQYQYTDQYPDLGTYLDEPVACFPFDSEPNKTATDPFADFPNYQYWDSEDNWVPHEVAHNGDEPSDVVLVIKETESFGCCEEQSILDQSDIVEFESFDEYQYFGDDGFFVTDAAEGEISVEETATNDEELGASLDLYVDPELTIYAEPVFAEEYYEEFPCADWTEAYYDQEPPLDDATNEATAVISELTIEYTASSYSRLVMMAGQLSEQISRLITGKRPEFQNAQLDEGDQRSIAR